VRRVVARHPEPDRRVARLAQPAAQEEVVPFSAVDPAALESQILPEAIDQILEHRLEHLGDVVDALDLGERVLQLAIEQLEVGRRGGLRPWLIACAHRL